MSNKILKLGELFCGPGGLSLGAKEAKVADGHGSSAAINVSWASDYHYDTCETYKENFPTTKVICKDVKDLSLDELSPVDIFAYGFPCNDFSIVGKTKGLNGKFGGLYQYGVEILNKFSPMFFVAENVGGITSANEGTAFQLILDKLKKSGKYGYKLTPHKYKFEEYGIPQTRHRIIIVGVCNSLNLEFKVPLPTHIGNYRTSKNAIEDPVISENAPNNEKTKQSAKVIERLKLIKPGDNIWNTQLPEGLQLNVKGAKLSQIYKRLHPEKPSYTLTGSGGGGTHGYHYSEPRALTNRERARIQTFPDHFTFKGSKESVRRQIGMAVSPQMSKVIFETILKLYLGVKYNSTENNIQQ